MTDLEADASVFDLVEGVDGLSDGTARNLDDAGFQTVGDVRDAEVDELEAVPYVAHERAEQLLALASEESVEDSREIVLEATLGEKLVLSMAERKGYADPRYVVETDEAVEWEAATGENWHTRRLRMADGVAGESRREFDLVLGAAIRIEDPPVKRNRTDAHAPSWRVESVEAVGRASPSSMATLQGQQEDDPDRPEGDDSWRKFTERGRA